MKKKFFVRVLGHHQSISDGWGEVIPDYISRVETFEGYLGLLNNTKHKNAPSFKTVVVHDSACKG